MTIVESADIRVSPGHEARLGCSIPQNGHPPDGEEQSIARVVESLVARFPAVPEPIVRGCVAHICAGFADAPIRAYIPILVAREARAALIDYSSPAEHAPVG